VKLRWAGFAPDLDQATPGIWTDCNHIIPTLRGFRGAPSPVTIGLPAAAGAATGAAIVKKLDNTARFFVASTAKIEEATSGTAYTDRSRVGGYTSTNRFRFTQYGDVTLATNKSEVIQVSTTGSFADQSTAPKAGIIETVNQFVFAFDTIDGTYGTSPDRWWCCALGDYTSWTPAIATQAATGRLTSSPGPITAGVRLGDNIIVYKERAMYVGVYTGPPFIWRFDEIPGTVGVAGNEAVVSVGTAHYFPGYEDFYVFDGARAVPLDSPVKQWFFADLSKQNASKIIGVHDFDRTLIKWHYPSEGQSTLNRCIVYNYKTGRWGLDHQTIEYAVQYIPSGTVYDDLGATYSTYADLPNIPYDQFYQASRPVPSIINTSHLVQLLNGACQTAYFVTGDYGDEEYFTTILGITPRWAQKPTSSTLTNYYREYLGDNLTTGVTTSLQNGRYDFMRSSRFHRFRQDMIGDFEVYGADIRPKKGGLE